MTTETTPTASPTTEETKRREALINGARVVLVALGDLVGGPGRFKSVVDLGCGEGAWLAAAERLGIALRLGVDLVGGEKLFDGHFITADVARPLDLANAAVVATWLGQGDAGDKRFDLAIGVEVGEHLDGGTRSAGTYVANLCRAADLVLFSAAVPGQGGEHHVNERWPEYWAALFRREGYGAADALRPLVWLDERVLWWYRQNLVVYYRRASAWGGYFGRHLVEPVLPLVHPLLYSRGRDAGRP